jgi:ribosomal protein S18 acetylase RimI-like enzyme
VHVVDGFFETQVPGVAEFAAAAGYAPHTYGFLMRRALAEPIVNAPLPAGFEVRPVRPEDHRTIWDADTEAFLDHDEPAERDESDFVTWFAQPAIDSSLWRVAWAGDEVAGSVMTIIWHDENEALGVRRAWLEHVSVRRPWRGRGVASALIAETLLMLRAMGLDEAMLGVHGENPTGAVGVYERAGFRTHRRWSLWRKGIALPAEDVDRAAAAPAI